MNDDKIVEVAYQTDDFLVKLMTENEMNPLTLGSLLLARLTLANDEFGSGEEWRNVLVYASNKKPKVAEAIH